LLAALIYDILTTMVENPSGADHAIKSNRLKRIKEQEIVERQKGNPLKGGTQQAIFTHRPKGRGGLPPGCDPCGGRGHR